MKATEISIRRTLLQYNMKAKELSASEYELDIVSKYVGNQQRNRYALTNGKGNRTTDLITGQAMLYYLEGILKGIGIMRDFHYAT